MPAASFIPGPGDSAVENNPLTQVGRLSEILNSNAEAQNRLQLTQLAAQESQMRLQSAALENQRMNLIISMMPEEHRLEMKQKAAAIENSQIQGSLMKGEALAQGLKNIDTLNPWSTQNQLQESLLRQHRAETDRLEQEAKDRKEATDWWTKNQGPDILEAMGMPPAARKHNMPLAAAQFMMGLQQTQADTEVKKQQANWYATQANFYGDKVDLLQEKNDLARLAISTKKETQIEIAKIRASSPRNISPTQAAQLVANDPNQPLDIQMDAAQFILQSHSIKPEDIPPTLSPSGEIIPGRKDTQGFMDKARKFLGVLQAGRAKAPSTQPLAPEKVLIERDGKQYRVPKAQLAEALRQGYKEVK